MQGGPAGPDRVNGVVTVEAVAVHHRNHHRDGPAGHLFVLGVAGGRASPGGLVAAGMVQRPGAPGVRHRDQGVVTRPADGGPAQHVRELGLPPHGDEPLEGADAGDVLVERRLAHPEAGGEGRQGELVQPHLVGQLGRLGDHPVSVQPGPRHGRPI